MAIRRNVGGRYVKVREKDSSKGKKGTIMGNWSSSEAQKKSTAKKVSKSSSSTKKDTQSKKVSLSSTSKKTNKKPSTVKTQPKIKKSTSAPKQEKKKSFWASIFGFGK